MNEPVSDAIPSRASGSPQAPLPTTPDEAPPARPEAARSAPTRPKTFIPQKPRGNVIEFEVVDGLAIAYGDMLLGKPTADSHLHRGNYEAPTPQLWDHPEIPYAISPDLPNPDRVEKALAYFKQFTPVSFVPYSGQADGVVFEPTTGHCYSSVGRQGGLQPIKLSAGCQPAEIIHEIMHALGFVHEQSRPDRDQYVEILWQNIQDEYKPQYNVVPETFTAAIRGSTFDFRSAMLYRADTFANRPELPTMSSKTGEAIAPVSQGLSEGDIRRLNRLYNFHD